MILGSRIITIDGPAGAGKSTLAKALAARLGWTYLDTGAMYRAVGLAARQVGIDVENEASLAGLMEKIDIRVAAGPDATRVFLDDKDVSGKIREPIISSLASRASKWPVVRKAMVEMQRRLGNSGEIVAEGRDMGTVVFPDAILKFFLDAGLEERARRRYEELIALGEKVNSREILLDMKKRDDDDSSRSIAPLMPAEDAVRIDSTKMTIDMVLSSMMKLARNKSLIEA